MKKSNLLTKMIDIFKNVDPSSVLIFTVFIVSPLLILAISISDYMIILMVALIGTSLPIIIGLKDEKEIDRLWAEHRRKRGKVQEKYVIGDRIKELVNKINSMGVRDHKIGSADIAWQLEASNFRTEDILENYELPSLVELQKLSELFFFRTFKLGADISKFPEEEGNRILLCNMLFILTSDESYLSEDCIPESSFIREVFAEYEAAYNAECYDLLESYERSLT